MAFYPAIPASDGTSMAPPQNALFEVFELSDATFSTPLPLLTSAGTDGAPLVTTAQGVVPPVNVVSPNVSHIFKSGEWVWRRDSFDEAQAATESAASDAERSRVAAELAATAAQAPADDAIDAALERADLSGTIRQAVAGKLERADADAAYAVKPDGGGKPVGKGELFINVKDFGAKGDGAADDTAAIQAWLNAGGTTLHDGTYRISSTLVLSGDNKIFLTDNAVIAASTADMVMVRISGNYNHVSVTLDGKSKASIGITGTGVGHTIIRCRIVDIKSTGHARGIEMESAGGTTITENTITNIQGATISRGVTLFATTAAVTPSVIRNNTISNVTATEGDGIHVLYNNGGSIFLSAKTVIEGNQITNVTRRYIKVQGSDVRVFGNTLYSTSNVAPASPAPAIDIIQSERVVVERNEIYPNLLTGAIQVTGLTNAMLGGIVISGNSIRIENTRAQGHIYTTATIDLVIEGNTLYGGTFGVVVGSSTRPLVKSNIHYGGANDQVSFRLIGNTNAVVRDNTNMNPARPAYLRNDGTANQSVNNHTLYVAP